MPIKTRDKPLIEKKRGVYGADRFVRIIKEKMSRKTGRKYIVFSDEHYNPLGIVRSLGETGIKPILIVIKGKSRVASLSKYISVCHFVNNVKEGYEILIRMYGNEKNKPFLFTSDDIKTSYLDKRYEEIKNKFYFYNAGHGGRITYYMDKDNINQLAVKHGLNVLKAVKVKKGVIPDDIEYPVITKAISSTARDWKKDVFICHSDIELKEAYKKIKSSTVLLQKYINKKNELCLDGFSINKGKTVFYAIASTYNYILPDTYSSYMTVSNFRNKSLEDDLNGMFGEIGFEGIFSVEFLIDNNDNLYFCEINFRNSTWSYASTCAGMNLPVLWSRSMLKGEIEKNAYSVIPDNFNAIVEVPDLITRVIKGKKIRLSHWIRDYKNSQCKFLIGKKDPLPPLAVLADMFIRFITKTAEKASKILRR